MNKIHLLLLLTVCFSGCHDRIRTIDLYFDCDKNDTYQLWYIDPKVGWRGQRGSKPFDQAWFPWNEVWHEIVPYKVKHEDIHLLELYRMTRPYPPFWRSHAAPYDAYIISPQFPLRFVFDSEALNYGLLVSRRNQQEWHNITLSLEEMKKAWEIGYFRFPPVSQIPMADFPLVKDLEERLSEKGYGEACLTSPSPKKE